MEYIPAFGDSPSVVLEAENSSQFDFFQSSQNAQTTGFLTSSPYRCTDSPSSSSDQGDMDEEMEEMEVMEDEEDSRQRRLCAEDDLPSDVDRSFNSAMSVSVSASPCPYPSSNGTTSIFGSFSQRSRPDDERLSQLPMLGMASSMPSPLSKREKRRENENDDDSDYRHAQVELSPTGHKYTAKRAGMMFNMADVPSFSTSTKVMMMGKSNTVPIGTRTVGSTARAFGRESGKVNALASSSAAKSNPSARGLMLPPPAPLQTRKDPFGEMEMLPASSSTRITAQAKKPRPNSQSSSRRSSVNNGKMLFRPSPTRIESAPSLQTSAESSPAGSPAKRNSNSNMADAMQLDTPFRSLGGDNGDEQLSPSNASLNLGEADDFGNLFCDSPSVPAGKISGLGGMRLAAKVSGDPSPAQNSSSPGSSVDSPSIARLGPTLRGMEKAISVNAASGGLFGSSVRLGMSATRRTQPYKRPQLAPLTASDGSYSKLNSTASALPMLENNCEIKNGLLTANIVPFDAPRRPTSLGMRRAHSVCDQGNNADLFEGNDMGSNASSGRVLSTIETSSSSAIHPLIHVGGRLAPDLSCGAKPGSPFALGFGANEMDGKILPCHRVKEDGLVRITNETLRNLLDGHFDDRMSRYHIIDCRFEYEYSGGHISGAINVNNTNAVENMLLKPGLGMYANGESLPVPSRSGEGGAKPTVVVFHCEFSNKRAPAIAKFLRSRDRTLNNELYPRVHYPELYILEGGYCDFFDKCPDKCEPKAYVPMDDPKHEQKRDSDLHDFRKFTRTRSFTYGETQPQAVRPLQPCPRLAFDAASIAASRRAPPEKKETQPTLDQDMASPLSNVVQTRLLTDVLESPGGDGIDGSPCARLLTSSSSSGAALFGSSKTRLLGRAVGRSTFMRTSSYAGAPSRG